MRAYELHRPTSIDEAIRVLEEHGTHARPLGGGTDLVTGIMRDAVTGRGMPYPEHLVDLQTVGIAGIDMGPDHVTIGAMTLLAEVSESEQLRERLPLLADAAGSVASPEIRAIGTLGGNINQRPRCWFFRMKDFDCIKKGGDICFAVDGDNRFNAILEGHLCFIIHPSDLATALVALDAEAVVASAEGERIIRFDDYFVTPRENLLAENVLAPGDILTAVRVPYVREGMGQAWLKLNEKGRPTWDFAVASAAVTVDARDGQWHGGRIVLGGVAPVPYRASVIEEHLAGRDIRSSIAEATRQFREVARPMSDNGYKVDLAEAIAERAVLAALQSASATPVEGT